MRLGKINHIILFGGTQRLANFIALTKAGKNNFKITVISSARLLKSYLHDEKNSLQYFLKKNKIEYFNVPDIDVFDIDRYITRNTLGISFGAPWIFKKQLINKFKGKLIGAHSRDLPQDRGGGGFSWQVMRGKFIGRHILHLIDEGIDDGDIIYSAKFRFPLSCRIPEDYEKYMEREEIDFFKRFLKKIKTNYIFRQIPQKEEKSTYFPRLSTMHHGFIDWNWTAANLERFICAFDRPYKGASTFMNKRCIYIRDVKKVDENLSFHPFMRGLIYRKIKGQIFVAVSDGSIAVKQVRYENGEDAFKDIKLGSRFITPFKYLENALSFRAVYDAKGLKKR